MLPQAETTTRSQKRSQTKGLRTTSGLAAKFNVSPRTIIRWEERKIIPPAKIIRKRRYWDDDVEPRTDTTTTT